MTWRDRTWRTDNLHTQILEEILRPPLDEMLEIDEIPRGCSILLDMEVDAAGFWVRFQAHRPRWFRAVTSPWTGWYPWVGDPIRLTWDELARRRP